MNFNNNIVLQAKKTQDINRSKTKNQKILLEANNINYNNLNSYNIKMKIYNQIILKKMNNDSYNQLNKNNLINKFNNKK